jgi:hypothetical protein
VAVGVAGDVVAHPAAQVVAQVLEEHRVEAEQPADREAAQGLVGTQVDGVAPLLGHPLRALGDLAAVTERRGQDDA